MKIVVRLILFAALAALGVWLWTVFFPSPEKVIRKRLAELARTVSFSGHESIIARAANIQKLGGYFVPQTEITIDVRGREPYTLVDRDEIMQTALAARSAIASLRVDFLDANVVLAPDKLSAVVDLTVRARIAGDKDFIVQEMKFTFRKSQKEWLIFRIETVRTLSCIGGTLGYISA